MGNTYRLYGLEILRRLYGLEMMHRLYGLEILRRLYGIEILRRLEDLYGQAICIWRNAPACRAAETFKFASLLHNEG